ncbi:hypothetical protein [Pseudomonas tructae]|uniref:hypothetical protein n=1 Tax=Pseudomonas tructae TaxID=2518644 RepID=UPI001E2F9917|nr:hypothetical protein [Pseudomonas tructae]
MYLTTEMPECSGLDKSRLMIWVRFTPPPCSSNVFTGGAAGCQAHHPSVCGVLKGLLSVVGIVHGIQR